MATTNGLDKMSYAELLSFRSALERRSISRGLLGISFWRFRLRVLFCSAHIKRLGQRTVASRALRKFERALITHVGWPHVLNYTPNPPSRSSRDTIAKGALTGLYQQTVKPPKSGAPPETH
jgi:hypothetical protein